MYKKLLLSVAILLIAIFSFSVCFANNGFQEATDGVRDVVGGAEKAVEDAAKNISNASQDATNRVEEGVNNIGNAVMNNHNNDETKKDTNNNPGTQMTNNHYNATRTSANDTTFMGMNATAWTWLILGIAAIAIIALVWYYSMQIRSSHYSDRD